MKMVRLSVDTYGGRHLSRRFKSWSGIVGSLLLSGVAHAQILTEQPVYEVQPGIWVSELDNPRPNVAVTLGPLEAGLRAYEQGTEFSQTLSFEVESYASPLSPGTDPYSETEWFQQRDRSYGVYRNAGEANVPIRWSQYAPSALMSFETTSVRLGHGGQTLMWSRNFWDGNEMQRQFLPEQQWTLSDDTILVPVHVIDAYPPGGQPELTPAKAALLFDDVTYFQPNRKTAPGGELEEYLLRLDSDRTRHLGFQDVYKFYEVGNYVRPDDIFAQCGIQYRLASYTAIEVPAAVYEGRVARDYPEVATNCIIEYPDDVGVTFCAVPFERSRHGCSHDQNPEADSRQVGPEVIRHLAAQTLRQDLISGQVFRGHQPGMDVILMARLDAAEEAQDCPAPAFGLSDAHRWAAVATQAASKEPTTLSHEMGHVLLQTDAHYNPPNVASAQYGAANLMKAGGGDGRHIPGCQSWGRTLPGSAWNCDMRNVDQESSYLCDRMRLRATSIASSESNAETVDPLDMEMQSGEKLGWSYGRAADGPSLPAEFSSDHFSDGTESIVVPSGYVHVGSPLFKTADIAEVGTTVEVDVYVPAVVPNPYWVGSLAVSFEHAPTSTYALLGQYDLTGLERGGWTMLSFDLPTSVRDILLGDHPVGQFVVTMNTPGGGTQPLLIDGFRMAGDLETRTVSHQQGSAGMAVSTNALTSFEHLTDWSSTATLALVTEPVSDASYALAVEASGWTVVQSRWFNTSELPSLASQLAMDVYVPNPQPNPWWVGEVQIVIDCPDAGLHSAFIGNRSLMHLFHDEYNHIVFDLPQAVQTALASAGQCRVSPILNVSSGAGTFLLDRLGFR